MSDIFQTSTEKLEYTKIIQRIRSYTFSDLGKIAADKLSPCSELEKISTQLNQVSEFKKILDGNAVFPLDGIKDIRSTILQSAVLNSVLSPTALYAVATTLKAIRNISTFFEKQKEMYPELYQVSHVMIPNKILEYNIFQSIDEEGRVKDNASKELHSIREEIVELQALLRKSLEKILKNVSELGIAQEEIVTTRDGRLVIPIKSEQKAKIHGFIHSTSATGQTVFIEPAETLSMNNEVCELLFREKREIEKILRALTEQVHNDEDALSRNVELLCDIDLAYAKAKYSIEIKGNKPFIKESGYIKILDGYHPVLLLHHSRERVVPLNLEVGRSFATLLITGPNAGGKTVALKTIGICSLLLQSGVHIPVSPDSEFPIFKKIFVVIGDNQSLENDLSTYSSQILQLVDIIGNADSESLVLIDEIGGNTDPSEGGALAASILEYLTARGALTIASSHQEFLKAYVFNADRMENGAMEFDQKTLQPTYRFIIGYPGSSYALEIAKRLGIPEGILAKSVTLVGDQKNKLEKLLLHLQQQIYELENKHKALDDLYRENKELQSSFSSRIKNLNEEIKKTKLLAAEEAKTLLSKVNSTIERTVREIREQSASKQSIKNSHEQLRTIQHEVESFDSQQKSDDNSGRVRDHSFVAGEPITVSKNNQSGTVLSPPDSKGYLQVAVNAVKLKVHQSEIRHSQQTVSHPATISRVYSTPKTIQTEIDVRGLYGDEAVEIVDKFIDDAIVAGLHRVDIIHGKGTGALRKRIQTYLHEDTRVKNQRLGEWNEGGAGVTVIELA